MKEVETDRVFMHISSNLRGIIYMVLAGITFVLCDSFLKLMLLDVPPFQSLVLRGLTATGWCFALLLALGLWRQVPLALEKWTLARALAEVIAVSCFILALAQVPLADITAIYQTAPLLVLAGASVVWGEQVGLVRWLLIGLGLAGALLVAQPGRDGGSPLALLGFITAFAAALRDLLTRKAPATTPGLVVAFGVIVCVLIAAAINNLLFESWAPVTAQTWVYAMGAGFFVMLGHYFVFLSFRHATARVVAPFYYSFTLMAVVAGSVFFSEYPNALSLVGIAMIIACGLGVLYFERKETVS
jgi:drug/metabolite transporter (DMT)-like permease